MPKSYSETMSETKMMVDALRNNVGQVTKIDPTFISDFEATKVKVETLNAEQEKLKADLKSKTEELNTEMKNLNEKYAFAKKRVKVDVPQAQWKEYGIQDSK